MSLLDDLPFDFKGGEARIFRQNKLKDHDSIYDYLDINSFSNPVFQDMNVAEITNFLRDIISGDDLLAYLRKFECHARRAERNVKLMSKTWKECKKVDNAEGKQRVCKAHYEQYASKEVYKKGAFLRRFSSMSVIDETESE